MGTGPDQVRRPSTSQVLTDWIAEQWGASISYDPLPPIDSADATPTHWEMIHAAISRSPAVPVLLTLGTNTLSWTAAALAAAADRSHTVVVTGATVPLGEPGSDAPDNLAAALVSPALMQSKFAIEGHTDAKGNPEYNRKLSDQRALAVKELLVSKGVDPARLFSVGKGSSELANAGAPMAPENRRVKIVNLD